MQRGVKSPLPDSLFTQPRMWTRLVKCTSQFLNNTFPTNTISIITFVRRRTILGRHWLLHQVFAVIKWWHGSKAEIFNRLWMLDMLPRWLNNQIPLILCDGTLWKPKVIYYPFNNTGSEKIAVFFNHGLTSNKSVCHECFSNLYLYAIQWSYWEGWSGHIHSIFHVCIYSLYLGSRKKYVNTIIASF